MKFWNEPEGIAIETFTDIELAAELCRRLGDLDSTTITQKEGEKIYKELGGIDGFVELLRDTMVNDIRRYFAAQTEKERDIIRGGFARTAYWKAIITKE